MVAWQSLATGNCQLAGSPYWLQMRPGQFSEKNKAADFYTLYYYGGGFKLGLYDSVLALVHLSQYHIPLHFMFKK